MFQKIMFLWFASAICSFLSIQEAKPNIVRAAGNNKMEGAKLNSQPAQDHLQMSASWPVNGLTIGQVGGLSWDKSGRLHVFHRAERVWDYSSFDDNNVYQGDTTKPIFSALVILDSSSGQILEQSGFNRFYLPHGLEIDQEGNRWLTDIALHQVFRFGPNEDNPSLVLGRAFEPAKSNTDIERFCKPTDVAVAINGDFYVADGYCNSRLLKYSAKGILIGKFAEDVFAIPHSLALVEDLDLICVADREYRRIICFNAGLNDPKRLGETDREYGSNSELGRVFAIEYKNGFLFGVNGTDESRETPRGFTINIVNNGLIKYIVDVWDPVYDTFVAPHDLAVADDGNSVFIGEIGPNNIWKFIR